MRYAPYSQMTQKRCVSVCVCVCSEWWKKCCNVKILLNLGVDLGVTYITYNFFFFLLFRATHMAYGSSQARGLTGATASGLGHRHSNTNLSHVCDRHHSSWQCWILNVLSKARDQTWNLCFLVGFILPHHDRNSIYNFFCMKLFQNKKFKMIHKKIPVVNSILSLFTTGPFENQLLN